MAVKSMLKFVFVSWRGKKSKVETASGGFVSDTLQKKLKELEEENLSLRSEVSHAVLRKTRRGELLKRLRVFCVIVDVYSQANHLKSETETYEEKEQQLVNDCVKELSEFCLATNFFFGASVCEIACFSLHNSLREFACCVIFE